MGGSHPLRQVVRYRWRKMQLEQVVRALYPLHDRGPAPILQIDKVPPLFAQHHFRFGRRRAHDRIERLLDLGEARKGHAQRHTVLVVAQGSRDAVEQDADRGGQVLLESFRVVVGDPVVPQQPLVRQAPSVLVLAQHILEHVRVQPDIFRADAEHHAAMRNRNSELDGSIFLMHKSNNI